MMTGAGDSALEDREIALNRVRVGIAAHVFIYAMDDCFVARKIFCRDVGIDHPRQSSKTKHDALAR